ALTRGRRTAAARRRNRAGDDRPLACVRRTARLRRRPAEARQDRRRRRVGTVHGQGSGVMTAPIRYLGLALATIVVGLAVHFSGTLLPFAVGDILGDALWAVMMVWWISAVSPRSSLWTRGLVASAVCAAVECSQAVRTPGLDAIRQTTVGQLL